MRESQETFPERAPAEFSHSRYLRLAEIEERHFWFVGRRVLVEHMLTRNRVKKDGIIADLGCGTGFTLQFLARHGFRGIGVDLHAGSAGSSPNQPGAWFVRADVNRLPLQSGTFAGVIMLDVLEHVDDRQALAEACRALNPGGWVLLTVPAVPWLWSRRDTVAGHLRRYTRRQLLDLLAGAKLEVQEIRHYQFCLFPAVLASRLFGRRGDVPRIMEEQMLPYFNGALTWLNSREAELSDFIRWPWGSSLAALCRKT